MNLAQTGLRKQPFRTHGKPLELVTYASQRNAIQFLDETCTNEHGLGLFHGPPLSGKTTIVQEFASTLPRDHAVAIVDGAHMDPADLLQEILSQFGYDHGFKTAGERFNMIRVIALQQAAVGQAPVLVIENIHESTPVLLEVLCELAEMSVNGSSAIRIILVSHQSMLPIVEAPAMRSIEKRLTGKFLLKPMTRTETATYAHRKLESGGCYRPKAVMPPVVCDRLHSESGGWPGVIDQLAIMALAKAEHIPLQAEHIPRTPKKKHKPPNVIDPPPQLILTCKRETLKKFTLDGPRYLIGRYALCDIEIVHEWISRQHAVLIRNDRSTVIVDLKSRNGVYVNGKRVARQVLMNDDVIALGDHHLKFVDPSVTNRLTLRGAGWDDTTLVESIRTLRKAMLRQIKGKN
ncbi:MAG: FHA domain-containing protein [Gammaproteobacteria bacterium]|nr:FHA domain-containing protein [Gammaproteobacteria bacterium]